MHDFLRAVGFSRIKDRVELGNVLQIITTSAGAHISKDIISSVLNNENDSVQSSKIHNVDKPLSGEKNIEIVRNFAGRAGIAVRGEIDENGTFNYEYYFPYYNGRYISLNEDLTVQKFSDRNDYDGICDLEDGGMSLIFHMNRLNDFSGEKAAHIGHGDSVRGFTTDIRRGIGTESGEYDNSTIFMSNVNVKLSALSVSGKVLIPLMRTREYIGRQRRKNERRLKMLEEARKGSQEAIDNLTLDRLDAYSRAVTRLNNEDVLTVVETYLMPYGISCDQYSVLGDILSCEEVKNELTGEVLYQMVVISNDIMIDICINSEDLLGEPSPGRRFEGMVWLQGTVE